MFLKEFFEKFKLSLNDFLKKIILKKKMDHFLSHCLNMSFWVLEEVNLETKSAADTENMKNYPACKYLTYSEIPF